MIHKCTRCNNTFESKSKNAIYCPACENERALLRAKVGNARLCPVCRDFYDRKTSVVCMTVDASDNRAHREECPRCAALSDNAKRELELSRRKEVRTIVAPPSERKVGRSKKNIKPLPPPPEKPKEVKPTAKKRYERKSEAVIDLSYINRIRLNDTDEVRSKRIGKAYQLLKLKWRTMLPEERRPYLFKMYDAILEEEMKYR